ncbi:MAG TPA: hypothetical protein VGK73_23155 [Polyangiaceae bacterium]
MNVRVAVMSFGLCLACGAAPDSASTDEPMGLERAAASNKDFDVDYADCAEFAGIGVVPRQNALPLVPSHYTLAGDAQNAVIVVRVASCTSSVIDGKAAGATLTSQIGISVLGEDATADINNYTLFFATNQARLHARFQGAGVDADNTNGISFSLSSGVLDVNSSSAHTPTFAVDGSAATPSSPPTQFIASWWADGNHGVVRSRTVLPSIRFGGSSTVLTTPAGSALANLIGGTTLTFPFLDSYNTFASSHLEVRDTD